MYVIISIKAPIEHTPPMFTYVPWPPPYKYWCGYNKNAHIYILSVRNNDFICFSIVLLPDRFPTTGETSVKHL